VWWLTWSSGKSRWFGPFFLAHKAFSSSDGAINAIPWWGHAKNRSKQADDGAYNEDPARDRTAPIRSSFLAKRYVDTKTHQSKVISIQKSLLSSCHP
jgi:hypothetical protein